MKEIPCPCAKAQELVSLGLLSLWAVAAGTKRSAAASCGPMSEWWTTTVFVLGACASLASAPTGID